jgi:hypothetical protein
MITLYFQRGGDDWSARGPFEAYRWYATFATQSPIRPGEHVLVAPLNGNWTAVQSSNARTNPAAFRAALAEADQVGFVLGGGDGFGHGVRATGRRGWSSPTFGLNDRTAGSMEVAPEPEVRRCATIRSFRRSTPSVTT